MHDDTPRDRATPPSGGARSTEHPTEDELGLDTVVETVKHGIDQVADKVKGLLRSGR